MDWEVEVWEWDGEVEMFADWMLYVKYLKKQDEIHRCRNEVKGLQEWVEHLEDKAIKA